MYDAGDYEIEMLQNELARNGISQDQLDLCNYAGLTYTEMKGIVRAAIANKKKKEARQNEEMPKCIFRGKSASNHERIYGLSVDGNGLIGLDHSHT